jgi:hypothetical protein
MPSLWRFDQVAALDKERAVRLKNAPTWPGLMEMIRSALRVSLIEGGVRFGFDESGRNAIDLRAVVQFPIGAELFDWFFNARNPRHSVSRGSGVCQNRLLQPSDEDKYFIGQQAVVGYFRAQSRAF